MSIQGIANEKSNEWKHYFLSVIDEIKQNDDSVYFRDPVDEVNDIAPGYYKQIQNPMNLSQLQIELMDGTIVTPQEFITKFNLIWKNSIQYNGDGHPVTKAAKRIRSSVMKSLRKQYNLDERVIMNPGDRKSNRKSLRLRKEECDLNEKKEKEYDDHQNKQVINDVMKMEGVKNHRSSISSVFPSNFIHLNANDHAMPPLEPESIEPILYSVDDAKYMMHEQRIKQLNSRISELSRELRLVRHEKDDMNEKHIKKIKELRMSYTRLLNAFNRLSGIVNDINGYIMNQTNVANNLL